MRTTLSLDDDVAAAIERLRRERDATLKEIVNRAIRLGLPLLLKPPDREAPYETPSTSLGGCLIGSLDDVAHALALGEGQAFR